MFAGKFLVAMYFHVILKVSGSSAFQSTNSTQLGIAVMNLEIMIILFIVGGEEKVAIRTLDMPHHMIL